MITVYRTKSSERARLEQQLQIALQQAFADLRELIGSIIEADGEISGAFWSQQRRILTETLLPVIVRALQANLEIETESIAERGGIVPDLDTDIDAAARRLVAAIVADVLENAAQEAEALLDNPEGSQRKFGALSEQRAELIAVTEATRITSIVQLLTWSATRPIVKVVSDPPYIVGKRWRVQRGEKVCPICAPLDGMLVSLDEQFDSGELVVTAPPAHPRCRCWLEPVWSDETFAKPPGEEDTTDPCVDVIGYYPQINCYTDALDQFGIQVSGTFTPGQLEIILNAVNVTANRIIQECGTDLSMHEVFQAVFGTVQFRYDPNDAEDAYGVTDTNTVPGLGIIYLPQGLFDVTVENRDLDMEFVIIHELGHVFQNYLGQVPEDETDEFEITIEDSGEEYNLTITVPERTPYVIEDYLNATGGYWTPVARDFGSWKGGFEEDDLGVTALTSQNFDPENPAREFYYVDRQGNRVSEDDVVYFREQGTYLPGDYSEEEIDGQAVLEFFPNESGATSHPTPMEGYSDSFAVFMRLGADFLPDDEIRQSFFTQQFCLWVTELIARNEDHTN